MRSVLAAWLIVLMALCAPSPSPGGGAFAYSSGQIPAAESGTCRKAHDFAYTPEQMRIMMSFKPAPLLMEKEKETFEGIRNRRKDAFRSMNRALRTNNGQAYYRAVRKLMGENGLLKDQIKKTRGRLSDALDRLYNDFEVFGDDPDSWPPFARAEEEKLRKGKELVGKFTRAEDPFFKYLHARLRTTYEICITDPGTFEANRTFLKTGVRASQDIFRAYEKVLDALIRADRKARSMSKEAAVSPQHASCICSRSSSIS